MFTFFKLKFTFSSLKRHKIKEMLLKNFIISFLHETYGEKKKKVCFINARIIYITTKNNCKICFYFISR